MRAWTDVCVCKARSHVGLEAPKIPQLAQREISVGIFCDPQGWHWAGGKSRVRGVKCYRGKCKLSLTTGAESMFSLTQSGPLIFHKVKRNLAVATPGWVLIRLFKEVWNKHTHKHMVSCCYRMDSRHGFAWKVVAPISFFFLKPGLPPSFLVHTPLTASFCEQRIGHLSSHGGTAQQAEQHVSRHCHRES